MVVAASAESRVQLRGLSKGMVRPVHKRTWPARTGTGMTRPPRAGLGVFLGWPVQAHGPVPGGGRAVLRHGWLEALHLDSLRAYPGV